MALFLLVFIMYSSRFSRPIHAGVHNVRESASLFIHVPVDYKNIIPEKVSYRHIFRKRYRLRADTWSLATN